MVRELHIDPLREGLREVGLKRRLGVCYGKHDGVFWWLHDIGRHGRNWVRTWRPPGKIRLGHASGARTFIGDPLLDVRHVGGDPALLLAMATPEARELWLRFIRAGGYVNMAVMGISAPLKEPIHERVKLLTATRKSLTVPSDVPKALMQRATTDPLE